MLRDYKRENSRFFDMKERFKARIAGLEQDLQVRACAWVRVHGFGCVGCICGRVGGPWRCSREHMESMAQQTAAAAGRARKLPHR